MTGTRRRALKLGLALLAACVLLAWAGHAIYEQRRTRILPGERWAIGAFTFSPSGDLLALGHGNRLEVWDWERQVVVREHTFAPYRYTVHDAAFSPDERSIAVLWSGIASLVSLADGAVRPIPSEPALRVAVSGDRVALATERGVAVHARGDGAHLRTLGLGRWDWSSQRSGVLAFSRGGDLVAATEWGGFWLWSVDRGELVVDRPDVRSHEVTSLAATSDEGFLRARGHGRLLAGEKSPRVEIRREPSGIAVATLDLGESGPLAFVEATALSGSGELVAVSVSRCADREGLIDVHAEVTVWDVAHAQLVATFRDHPTDRCRSLAFCPTKNVLAAAWGGKVYLWPIRR